MPRRTAKSFSRLVKQMAASESLTEQLNAENQMEWISRMNNTQNRTAEVVNIELIFT